MQVTSFRQGLEICLMDLEKNQRDQLLDSLKPVPPPSDMEFSLNNRRVYLLSLEDDDRLRTIPQVAEKLIVRKLSKKEKGLLQEISSGAHPVVSKYLDTQRLKRYAETDENYDRTPSEWRSQLNFILYLKSKGWSYDQLLEFYQLAPSELFLEALWYSGASPKQLEGFKEFPEELQKLLLANGEKTKEKDLRDPLMIGYAQAVSLLVVSGKMSPMQWMRLDDKIKANFIAAPFLAEHLTKLKDFESVLQFFEGDGQETMALYIARALTIVKMSQGGQTFDEIQRALQKAVQREQAFRSGYPESFKKLEERGFNYLEYEAFNDEFLHQIFENVDFYLELWMEYQEAGARAFCKEHAGKTLDLVLQHSEAFFSLLGAYKASIETVLMKDLSRFSVLLQHAPSVRILAMKWNYTAEQLMSLPETQLNRVLADPASFDAQLVNASFFRSIYLYFRKALSWVFYVLTSPFRWVGLST